MDSAHGKKRINREGAFSPFILMLEHILYFICFLWGLLCAWAVIQGLDA